MARANDPDIKCEPNGNFRPLQCRPVVESSADNATNVSSTSEEMTRSRRTRTRTTSSRGQQNCRCVEPVNGTTIEGSELLLGVRDKRPNCDDGMHVAGADLGILEWWGCNNNAREARAQKKKLKPRPFNETTPVLIAFSIILLLGV
jgi:hypothetical protein